jgi:hypothetical protein
MVVRSTSEGRACGTDKVLHEKAALCEYRCVTPLNGDNLIDVKLSPAPAGQFFADMPTGNGGEQYPKGPRVNALQDRVALCEYRRIDILNPGTFCEQLAPSHRRGLFLCNGHTAIVFG